MQHLECWRHFLSACRITDIALCDALLLQFCGHANDLFGESAIMANMHLRGHMKELLGDYGLLALFLLMIQSYSGKTVEQ